jgi:hypothetical protein
MGLEDLFRVEIIGPDREMGRSDSGKRQAPSLRFGVHKVIKIPQGGSVKILSHLFG